jgi:hypothetical protein
MPEPDNKKTSMDQQRLVDLITTIDHAMQHIDAVLRAVFALYVGGNAPPSQVEVVALGSKVEELLQGVDPVTRLVVVSGHCAAMLQAVSDDLQKHMTVN